MAFAFVHGHPFFAAGFDSDNDGPRVFASCSASARAGGGASFCHPGRSRRGRRGCSFSWGDGIARRFEIVDTPTAYLVYFDARDFRREDLRVSVFDGRLLVRASRQDDEHVIEKAWNLPKDVLQDGVTAKLDDSQELSIVLPKVPEEGKAVFDVPIEGGMADQVPVEPDAPGPSGQDASMEVDADGGWEEVEDEDVARAREKGKAPVGASVVQEADKTHE